MPRRGITRLLELIQLGEQQSSVGDCIDSKIVSASVGSSAAQRDIDPRKSAVRRADRQLRRLGDDSGISANTGREQRSGAEAFPLFIDDGSDEDLPAGFGGYSRHCSG